MPATNAGELAYKSIRELGALLRGRELSPVDLVQGFFDRIKTLNPSLNGFVYLNEDYALQEAKRAEAAILGGEYASPLMGVPTAIKDLNDSRPGWKGTFGGIPALRDHVIDSYCNFAERMETAGAIPLGKTNSPTMGFRGTCDNYLVGPTHNPFDLGRNSGGSSGGSAAAVAAGFVPFAEGTDGGGSIRIPAAWCNLFGFKGTSGRVARLSRPSAFGASSLFTFEGCLTRSVEDTAFVMEELCGPDERDPHSLPDRVAWLESSSGSVKGLRVAYSPNLGVFPVEAAVERTVRDAARAFEEGGAHVEEVSMRLPYSALEYGDLWCRLMVPSSIVRIENLRRAGIDLRKDFPNDLPPELVYWVDRVNTQTVVEAARDGEMRTTVYDAVQKVFEDYDLLLTPTLACLPVENSNDRNTLGPSELNGVPLNRSIGWCLTFFFNFTGHPAASVPAGLVDEKWPVGLQIIGKRFQDADVMRASAFFEAARPWSQHYQRVSEVLEAATSQ